MKKNRMIKRILCMVLTLIVGISMMGMSVYAAGTQAFPAKRLKNLIQG